jgi:hypothetical protein
LPIKRHYWPVPGTADFAIFPTILALIWQDWKVYGPCRLMKPKSLSLKNFIVSLLENLKETFFFSHLKQIINFFVHSLQE